MRELNLDQLRTLVAIADLGTFSAAAKALHLAQPTVSLHISELESRLGAQLVARGSRSVTLTPAGAALVERGRRCCAMPTTPSTRCAGRPKAASAACGWAPRPAW